jgi:hypothetical protein
MAHGDRGHPITAIGTEGMGAIIVAIGHDGLSVRRHADASSVARMDELGAIIGLSPRGQSKHEFRLWIDKEAGIPR